MSPFARFAMRGIASACLLALAAIAPQAARAEGAKVILVLDASGSMWGQIEGRTKIEIAREAVAKILSSWRPSDDLGLIAYGHRTKGDCTDIELLIPPAPLNKEAFQSTVNRLNPKGKTPMTEAVRRAAEALKSTEQAATVILVSDGEETCDADPCAVASELEAAGVGLTVHAVGFDIADLKTRAQLQCLAENTGGMFVTANNAEELEKALATTVAAAQQATPEPAKQAEPPASPVTLEARAVAAEGSPEIVEGLFWQVFAAGADGKPAGQAIEYSYDIPYKAKLEPGNYVLQVRYGMATVNQPVTIEAGKVAETTVALNVGALTVRAFDKEGASDPLDAAFTLSNADHSNDDTQYGTEATFIAPAGSWSLKVAQGAAKLETGVEITAGETTELDLVIGTGTIHAGALYADGGPEVADGIFFEVVKGDPKNGEVIAYSYDPKMAFVVPAGDYFLRAKAGEAVASVPVSVSAGGEAAATVVLGAGVLAVSRGAQFSSCALFGARKDIAGNRAYFGTWYDAEYQTVAPAGDYVVECKRDDGSKEEKPATVKAGERTETSL